MEQAEKIGIEHLVLPGESGENGFAAKPEPLHAYNVSYLYDFTYILLRQCYVRNVTHVMLR